MADLPQVTQVRLAAASSPEVTRGILGRVRVVVNGLVVQGAYLRRTLDGRLVLSFPARRDGSGGQRLYTRSISDEVRRDVARQVCEHMQIKQDPAP